MMNCVKKNISRIQSLKFKNNCHRKAARRIACITAIQTKTFLRMLQLTHFKFRTTT